MTDAPKLNPTPGPSISHEFDCSHDPCVCPSTPQEPRQAAIARMGEALSDKFHMKGGLEIGVARCALDAFLSDPQSVIDLLVAEKVLEVVHQFTCSLSLDCGDCDCSALYRVTPESG